MVCFLECYADWDDLLAVLKDGSNCGFHCGGKNILHDPAVHKDGGIGWWH